PFSAERHVAGPDRQTGVDLETLDFLTPGIGDDDVAEPDVRARFGEDRLHLLVERVGFGRVRAAVAFLDERRQRRIAPVRGLRLLLVRQVADVDVEGRVAWR